MNPFDLTQKRVLITGAGNGLGREMALQLAELGASLILTDINVSALTQTSKDIAELSISQPSIAKECGRAPLIVAHDVTSESDWQVVRDAVAQQFGELDALVNNAGIMVHMPFPMTTLEQLRKTMAVNVESIFIGCQTMLPLLKQAGTHTAGSSIVNVSSIFGQVAGPMHSAYCASKGAVTLLTKSLANELPRLGMKIRCNSIHPGIMNAGVSITGMNALVDLGAFRTTAEAEAALCMAIPYGRVGNASEIPGAVAFLISDASTLINGAEITLDGGYTAV